MTCLLSEYTPSCLEERQHSFATSPLQIRLWIFFCIKLFATAILASFSDVSISGKKIFKQRKIICRIS